MTAEPFSTELAVRSLTRSDAPLVAALLASQPPEYLRFYYTFGRDIADIEALLAARHRDVYSGIFWRGRLICVFTLRGWDEGFEVPSYGLMVRADQRGRAVLKVATETAKLIARLAGSPRLMCKVHPENFACVHATLREGFVPTGIEPSTGNVIYHCELVTA